MCKCIGQNSQPGTKTLGQATGSAKPSGATGARGTRQLCFPRCVSSSIHTYYACRPAYKHIMYILIFTAEGYHVYACIYLYGQAHVYITTDVFVWKPLCVHSYVFACLTLCCPNLLYKGVRRNMWTGTTHSEARKHAQRWVGANECNAPTPAS